MTKKYGSQGPKRKYIRGQKPLPCCPFPPGRASEPWPPYGWSAYHRNIQEVASVKNKMFKGKKGYLIRKTGKKLLS